MDPSSATIPSSSEISRYRGGKVPWHPRDCRFQALCPLAGPAVCAAWEQQIEFAPLGAHEARGSAGIPAGVLQQVQGKKVSFVLELAGEGLALSFRRARPCGFQRGQGFAVTPNGVCKLVAKDKGQFRIVQPLGECLPDLDRLAIRPSLDRLACNHLDAAASRGAWLQVRCNGFAISINIDRD